jgi:hypothetical protein
LCQLKIAHATREVAESAAERLRHNGATRGLTLHVYRCDYAPPSHPHWHVGSRRIAYL